MRRFLLTSLMGMLMAQLAFGVDIKSQIGMQDLNVDADGVSHGTFQRRTSTGGTITLDKIDGNQIPWSSAGNRTIRPQHIIGPGTGNISGYDNGTFTGRISAPSIGSASYTDNGYFNDLITGGPWVDVRKAVPTISIIQTGAANTAAWNTWVATLPYGTEIKFPKGGFQFDNGVRIHDKNGIKVVGTGDGRFCATEWIKTGSTDNNLAWLDISDTAYGTFSDICFSGNGYGIGTYIHRNLEIPSAPHTPVLDNGYTSALDFTRCRWDHFDVGVQVGSLYYTESNNEDITFHNPMFTFNRVGYSQYYQNSLQNSMINPYFENNAYGIWLGNSFGQTGSLFLYNINMTHNTTDIYYYQPAEVHIYGGRSETAKYFIDDSGLFSSLAFPGITMDGVTIVNQTDNTVPIIKSSGGGISASNCVFGNWNEAPQFLQAVVARAKSVFNGCTFNSMADFSSTLYGQYSIYGSKGWDGAAYQPLADGVRTGEDGVANTDTINAQFGPLFYLAGSPDNVITTITNPSPGQIIYIRCEDNTYSVQHSSTILLKGATNFVCSTSVDTLTLYYQKANNRWIELGRNQ